MVFSIWIYFCWLFSNKLTTQIENSIIIKTKEDDESVSKLKFYFREGKLIQNSVKNYSHVYRILLKGNYLKSQFTEYEEEDWEQNFSLT